MSEIGLAEARAPLVLALDVGTSSVRALVYDAAGRAVRGAAARQAVAPRTTPDGGVEIDADGLVACTTAVLDALADAAPEALRAVRAVGACTFWHSLVGVDGAGRALTPVYLWADARSHAAASALRETLDERAVHARTGCVLHWSYWPAKLRWLAATRPDLARRVRRWLSFGEYLYLQLFGATHNSLSMASGTGLLDQHTLSWDAEVLAAIPLDAARLAPLADTPLAGLRPAFAARWPPLRAVPWFPARGDGACSNVGCGCVTRDRFALMVGTSGALRVAWRATDVAIPWGVWCYRLDAARVVLGGALNNGGNLFAWLDATLRLPPSPALDATLAALPPDGHGLTVLPFLAGERSPGWAPVARGAIVGLTLATQPVDILRAGLEAVALQFARIADLLDAAVPGPQTLIATGGALLRSATWTQIIADALGRPLTLCAEAEASSRGAALLALEALGAIPSVEALPAALGAVFPPDPARHTRYQAALARQQRLYDLLVAPDAASGPPPPGSLLPGDTPPDPPARHD
ncbi:MAG TPA: gluconokinase [Chloroflexota bacterium]|nr:gluconokinase [Chloroflexota bacterium]